MANPTFSGLQHALFNFQERIVSDDFNREQQFAANALAELLRLPLTAIAIESEAEGKTTPASAAGNPLRAIVFEGIRFRPEIGTTTGFVEPGAALVVYPDASPHPADSPARLILDPGIQSAGTLTLTAGGGGARIDVVECQPTNVVTEADSRDIFNPATGLFSPSLVNKVARGGLTYRIRTGTAGAGFPGTASGWLPIAVCLVPSAATTWDDCTVWDVRPLLADLARPPHLVTAEWPQTGRQHAAAIDQGSDEWRAFGIVEGELSGWKVGGDLSPTIDGFGYLRLDNGGGATPFPAGMTSIQEPGFAAVQNRPWYLYLAQPFGLPRWAKYTPVGVGGERRPVSPRGIPIFTQKGPSGLSGKAGSAIALPTATGLGGTTTNAAVVLSGGYTTGPSFIGCTVAGSTDTGGGVFILSPASGNNTATPTYTLTDNVTHPASAVKLRLYVLTTVTEAGADAYALQRQVSIRDASLNNYSSSLSKTALTFTGASGFQDLVEVNLELPPNLPTGAARTLTLIVSYGAVGGGTIGTFSAQSVWVAGWTLG